MVYTSVLDSDTESNNESQELTNNSILLISLFSVIGFILIALLAGFSFSKRPRTFERTNSTISGSTNVALSNISYSNNIAYLDNIST